MTVNLIKENTDEALMIAYKEGSISAFELLYARHKAPLYRYFLRQIHSVESAQDLYQECWARIIKSSGNYAVSAKWTTWAYRIAHNLCIDHFRGAKSHESYDESEPQEQNGSDSVVAQSGSTPEKAHQQSRLAEQLRYCIQRLPADQREVFLLNQDTDMNLKMLAEVVGATYESVKTKLRYAKAKLQACLRIKQGVA